MKRVWQSDQVMAYDCLLSDSLTKWWYMIAYCLTVWPGDGIWLLIVWWLFEPKWWYIWWLIVWQSNQVMVYDCLLSDSLTKWWYMWLLIVWQLDLIALFQVNVCDCLFQVIIHDCWQCDQVIVYRLSCTLWALGYGLMPHLIIMLQS